MDDVSPSLDYCITTIRKENQSTPRLADDSPRDKPWDTYKALAEKVKQIYAQAEDFERYAERVHDCGDPIRFGHVVDNETGEDKMRLRDARFCRVKLCPLCQSRRSMMWQARFYQALPRILEQHPKSRWLFLTLTVSDPPITELGETLTMMNSAWQRLIQRKDLRPVEGWIRTTEITRDRNGDAHPHFHALLMVPPSWFSHNYVKHDRWVELWRKCLRVGYDPSVRIQTIKPKAHDFESIQYALGRAVKETLKYSTKPSDVINNHQWFLELSRQVHRRRLIASGGSLKNVLKPDQETNDDLILADDETEDQEDKTVKRWAYSYDRNDQHYLRNRKFDRYPD